VPRQPRSRRAPSALGPGQLSHLTNRGVDRVDLFHADLDRIRFLAHLAGACLLTGIRYHAYCLMGNHLSSPL
jgi:hypothetical protein